jgi:hypothetical protein
MRVETVTVASCDRCGFRQGLAPGAPKPSTCPACGDGAPKAWPAIAGPDPEIGKNWHAYYGVREAS